MRIDGKRLRIRDNDHNTASCDAAMRREAEVAHRKAEAARG